MTDSFEQYYKLGKNFMNPLNDVSKTALELARRTHQGILEVASEGLTRVAEQLTRFSSIKRPEELLSLEKDCLNENINAWMGGCQKLTNILMGNFEELNKAFSANIKDQQSTASGAYASAGKSTDKDKERR